MSRLTRVMVFLAANLCTGVALAASGTAPVSDASAQYAMTDIGSLGRLSTSPESINDTGQIVGFSQTPDGNQHAFLWQGGKMTKLAALKGDQSSMAFSINNKGQMVGISVRDGGATHAVLWDHGSVVDLGLVGSDDRHTGLARGINDNGQVIVNRASLRDSSISALFNPALQGHHVLLCTRAGVRSGRPLGKNIINAAAINNSGMIVGEQWGSSPPHLRAYLWKDGGTTDLGAFLPTGINTSGEIVGTRLTGKATPSTAVLWKNGTLTSLPSPASVRAFGVGINDKEEIVGYTSPIPSTAVLFPANSAMLWSGGRCIDLNACLASKDEWTRITPTAINNLGQIVGYGMHNGKPAAFVMTPIER